MLDGAVRSRPDRTPIPAREDDASCAITVRTRVAINAGVSSSVNVTSIVYPQSDGTDTPCVLRMTPAGR